MQPQYPIYPRHLTGPIFCALLVLSTLSLTSRSAAALGGDVVAGPDAAARRTATPIQTGQNPDSVVFDSTQSSQQLCLVDLDQATLPATVIDFSVDIAQPLHLAVYDLEGRQVRTLADGLWAPGSHRLAWHHEDDLGHLLAAGTYMVCLDTALKPADMDRAR